MGRPDLIWDKVKEIYPNYETEKDFKKVAQALFQVALDYQQTNKYLRDEVNFLRNEVA